MKALVFGPNGLIGAHLVERLLKAGYQVTGVSRSQKQLFSSPSYNHISLDISKKEEFLKLTGGYDIIFNLAAHIATGYSTDEAEDCLLVNALGTLHILEFMVEKKIERLIHSSSVTVYGRPKRRVAYEESPTNPIIVYGVSKLTSETYCNMYSELHGLKITMLRYASVYGPGITQKTALPIFIEKARKNEEITLYGDGMRSQDYVYVDDVVDANILAAEKKVTGVFNIGSGTKTTMKYLAETIVDVFDSTSKISYDQKRPRNLVLELILRKLERNWGMSQNIT